MIALSVASIDLIVKGRGAEHVSASGDGSGRYPVLSYAGVLIQKPREVSLVSQIRGAYRAKVPSQQAAASICGQDNAVKHEGFAVAWTERAYSDRRFGPVDTRDLGEEVAKST